LHAGHLRIKPLRLYEGIRELSSVRIRPVACILPSCKSSYSGAAACDAGASISSSALAAAGAPAWRTRALATPGMRSHATMATTCAAAASCPAHCCARCSAGCMQAGPLESRDALAAQSDLHGPTEALDADRTPAVRLLGAVPLSRTSCRMVSAARQILHLALEKTIYQIYKSMGRHAGDPPRELPHALERAAGALPGGAAGA
jgi:hypothetical protein